MTGEGEGWFPVEKIPAAEEQQPEEDESIWVLFSKTVDLEKFMVRFPAGPIYHYTEIGNLVIRSEKGGEIFELTVLKTDSEAPFTADLHYPSDDKWIHEHEVRTKDHIYRFHTQSLQLDSPAHQEFISSFSVY